METSPSARANTRLRQERVARNWRQSDLAELLGTTVASIKRWERGSHQPGAYYRIKLCALFGMSAEELGLVKEDAPPSATTEQNPLGAAPVLVSSAETLSLWMVPYLRNPHFTGRDDPLEQLAHHLAPAPSDNPASACRVALTQTQAIKGLGGIGKTQIAVEYAYRVRERGRYTHILWINAASEEAILTSFTELAELLPAFPAQGERDQHKLVAAIKRWLEQCQQRWLLIFDNADDLALVQRFFPQQGNGSLLLTTRAHAVASIAVPIDIEQMGLMEGTQLLLHRAHRLHASDEERNEAANVVIALDGFPLALDQAGAYVEETGCRFRDYLQLYHNHRNVLLARRGMQATSYPDSVATTWLLSFQKIAQTNPAAADLLRLCAFLAPDHIPEELLTDGVPHWPSSPLQKAAADPFAFDRMLEELLRFSLIKRLVKDHILSIHRLVQVIQIESMEREEQRQWAESIVRAVNGIFPPHPQDIASWSQCLRYLEQAQACDTLIQQHLLPFPEAADLLDRTGTYLREHASYTIAEPLYQRALNLREQLLGPQHLQVASSLNNLAHVYYKQEKYPEVEVLFLRVLQIREQQLGPEHLEVAYALHNLAALYKDQKKYAEAESLFRQALQIEERQLGTEHFQVTPLLNNLAILYKDQKKYAEAESLFRRALHIREQHLGAEHPDVAYSLNGLANLYYAQEKYAEAEPLYQRALYIREQQLGPQHPLVATPLTNLAELFFIQRRYTEAEPLYQRALSIWEQVLGVQHPRTQEARAAYTTLLQSMTKSLQSNERDSLAKSSEAEQVGNNAESYRE